jgi:hypothetical protein
MKRSFPVAVFAALVMSLWAAPAVRAQDEAIAAGSSGRLDATPSPPPPLPRPRAKGGTTTLYALDPLATTLCFEDGRYGHVIQQNEVRNRCSDIGYGRYDRGGLSVGIEGGRLGVIIDLGDADELRGRYGFDETVEQGQSFASLHARGDKVFVLKESRPQRFQEMSESEQLFAEGRSVASAPVKVGHIYLVRITDRHDKGFQLLAKLKVVSYVPGESVTIRWQAL